MGKLKTTEQIVKELGEIYGDRFSYHKVEYKRNNLPIILFCNKHQKEFKKRPDALLRAKVLGREKVVGCDKCKKEWRHPFLMTQDEYMNKLLEKRPDVLEKYDLSEAVYDGADKTIRVRCLKHNIWFNPIAGDFKDKQTECPDCSYEERGLKLRVSNEEFIEECKKIHNNKYGYDKTKYTLATKSIWIFCPVDDHGYFPQMARDHRHSKAGCPKCSQGKYHKWYKHGNSKKTQSERNCTEYHKWRKQVRSRFTECDCCGVPFGDGIIAEAHHLNSFTYFVDQRYDVENGVCLCEVCHSDYHAHVENHVATKYDYDLFKDSWGVFYG